MKPYTKILADYLANLKFEDIPSDVIDRSKQFILHTIGASIAATTSSMGKNAINVAKQMGSSSINATIIGDGTKVSLQNAVYANGSLADLLDWEDCASTGHPSAGVIPVCLSVAEAYHKSGKDFLTAVVGAYEVFMRISSAITPTTERRRVGGWGLYCWQIFAGALSAGKLMDIQGEKLCQLMGTAAIMTPNTLPYCHRSYSDFYHYTYGLTAKNAVECAWITQQGITKLTEALEADGGYYQGTSDQCDWDWFDRELGTRWMTTEIMIKNWPVNMWIQSCMDLIEQIQKDHNIDPDHIAKIETWPFIPFRSNPAPKDGYKSMVSAQYNIPYCIAMFLKGPKVGYDWLNEKYLNDPVILDMATKVVCTGEDKQVPHYIYFDMFAQGDYPEYGMKVFMDNGEVHEKTIHFPKGHPKNPYTRQDTIDSFAIQVEGIISNEDRDRIVSFVYDKLEDVEDMSVVADLISF